MSLKDKFKKLRSDYVINQVDNIVVPNFKDSEIIRKQFTFSGRVQKVGFRLQTSLLANKLGLTGWVRNTPQGEVEAEIQGQENKINFLKEYMQSLKRIKIKKVVEERMEAVYTEEGFLLIKEDE